MNILSVSAGITLIGLVSFAMPALADTPNTANFGAGFLPSPILAAETPAGTISTANYGAGFTGSPTLLGGNYTGTVYTANYGAGFVGSPNLIRTNTRIRYGHYGAGFFVSPPAWYGYGWY